MRPRLSDLWSVRGTIDRGPYLFWGVALALVKFNVDRVVARATTGRAFWPIHYWFPGDFFGLLPVEGDDRARALLPMALIALPFVASGIALTLRRTRSVRLPPASVLLFFVPVVNLIFFAILSAMPSTAGDGAEPASMRRGRWARWIPESALGSAVVAIGIVNLFGSALAVLSTTGMRSYGWGLFLGLPFFLGLTAAVIHGYHRPRSLTSCLMVGWLAVFLLAALLVGIAVEGVICVLMAAPIAFTLATLGATVGHVIQHRRPGAGDADVVLPTIALLLPALFGLERWIDAEPPTIVVRSSVEVDAPPEAVWEHVVAFAELPPPTELLFRAGVAYPLRAEMHGTGPGAVRRCVFSTGAFVEPIEIWNPPRRLEFGVSAQPPSMRELSPYPDLAPPHLEHFLASQRGRFLLEPLPGGRTRLEGTTWYTNRMWPSAYWRLWSDEVIHRIHLRVLRHIRDRAESA